MKYIVAKTKPIYWAVGNPIIEIGVTNPGELTVTGNSTMISNSNQKLFLNEVVAAGGFVGIPEKWMPILAQPEFTNA